MELKDYLLLLARRDGSDIYLSTGAPPCAKFQGALRGLDKEPLPPRRTGRSFPRVVKKRASKFPTKKMPVSS